MLVVILFFLACVVLVIQAWCLYWSGRGRREERVRFEDKIRAVKYRCELAERCGRLVTPYDVKIVKEIYDWNMDIRVFRGELGSEINNRVALSMGTSRRKGDENDPDVAYRLGVLYGLRIAEEMANKNMIYPDRVRKEDLPNSPSQEAAARGVRS